MQGHLKHFNDCQALQEALISRPDIHDKAKVLRRRRNFPLQVSAPFSNVFSGLLMSNPEQFNDVNKLSKLWLHECERVYADRLVTINDLNKYNKDAVAVTNISEGRSLASRTSTRKMMPNL